MMDSGARGCLLPVAVACCGCLLRLPVALPFYNSCNLLCSAFNHSIAGAGRWYGMRATQSTNGSRSALKSSPVCCSFVFHVSPSLGVGCLFICPATCEACVSAVSLVGRKMRRLSLEDAHSSRARGGSLLLWVTCSGQYN
jgi:hypothetical protein